MLENLIRSDPERSEGRVSQAAALVPVSTGETPANCSMPAAQAHLFSCAWSRLSSRSDGRCEPSGQGCRQPRLDRRRRQSRSTTRSFKRRTKQRKISITRNCAKRWKSVVFDGRNSWFKISLVGFNSPIFMCNRASSTNADRIF